MNKSDKYRANADQCGELAETARTDPERRRYRRMEDAWRSLAQEQDWLDGQISPVSGTDNSAITGNVPPAGAL
jgi:hypothetical protein